MATQTRYFVCSELSKKVEFWPASWGVGAATIPLSMGLTLKAYLKYYIGLHDASRKGKLCVFDKDVTAKGQVHSIIGLLQILAFGI